MHLPEKSLSEKVDINVNSFEEFNSRKNGTENPSPPAAHEESRET